MSGTPGTKVQRYGEIVKLRWIGDANESQERKLILKVNSKNSLSR